LRFGRQISGFQEGWAGLDLISCVGYLRMDL
jgi:hypothetical protein